MKTTSSPAGSARISKLLAAGKRLAASSRDRQVQNRQPSPDMQPGSQSVDPMQAGRPVNLSEAVAQVKNPQL